MNYFKNILIIQKTSKLNYLVEKYGYDCVRKSSEYEILKSSMEMHNKNCENFLNSLIKNKENDQSIDVMSDNFLDNEKIRNKIQNKKNDLIFTFGGDGTFLRAAHFIENDETLLVGVNTDSKLSRGFYCPIHAQQFLKNEENILRRFMTNHFEHKYLNQILVELKNKKYNYINDLYIGEKFMGRISKYNLKVDDKISQIIKSSGIIFSTYSGYSGWIQNANTISFPKFKNLLEKTSHEEFSRDELIKMYNEKLYIPEYENENSIFYFVREPGLKKIKDKNLEDYEGYLNFMEGIAKSIELENFCYEGVLILDGSFAFPVEYNEKIKISIGNNRIKTVYSL